MSSPGPVGPDSLNSGMVSFSSQCSVFLREKESLQRLAGPPGGEGCRQRAQVRKGYAFEVKKIAVGNWRLQNPVGKESSYFS